jgi:lipopolysaccharide biosynthesis glycosyltransferase
LKEEAGYFNAGVLLINNKLWREFSVKDKCLKFLTLFKTTAVMFDQDALNHVFNGRWLKASIRWNLQTSFLRKYRDFDLEMHKKIIEAVNHPGIIHYSSSSKPWDYFDVHPFRSLFSQQEKKFGVSRKNKSFLLLIRAFAKGIYLSIVFKYQLIGIFKGNS